MTGRVHWKVIQGLQPKSPGKTVCLITIYSAKLRIYSGIQSNLMDCRHSTVKMTLLILLKLL